METERGHMTERILNLTLEIIYLLTGENYIAFKISDGLVASNMMKIQNPVIDPPSHSLRQNKKVEEVTSEMIDLLTGEVPIRCQDVSVSFDAEEKYIGQKDLYKDVTMENRPPLTSPDGSRNRNTPERCPRPLYSRDSTQEHQENPQTRPLYSQDSMEEHHEIPQARPLYSGDSKHEHQEIPQTHPLYSRDVTQEHLDDQEHQEIPQARPLYSGDSTQEHQEIPQEDQSDGLTVVKVEDEEGMSMMGDEPSKEEECSPEISTDGPCNRNTPERCPHPLYSRDSTQEHQEIPQEHQEIPQEDQDENLLSIKVEVKEEAEEPSMVGDDPCKEEECSPEISTEVPPTRCRVPSLRMYKERNYMTEILQLTLKIIYLLTGEDYTVVKKTAGDNVTPSAHPRVRQRRSRTQNLIMDPPPPSLAPERNNDKKILEVTHKIIELLTGEVPIRCQDVSVYFSMEEWEYLEGHRDLYKDAMMENRPPLTSPDGSRNRNTPERCPRPLYSWDSTQEHQEIPQDDQGETLIAIKVEVDEEAEEPYVRGHKSYIEVEIPPEISTGPICPPVVHMDGYRNRNTPKRYPHPLYSWDSTQERHNIPQDGQGKMLLKVKEEAEESYVMGVKLCKEEEIPVEISTNVSFSPDGRYRHYKTEEPEIDNLTSHSSRTPSINPVLHSGHPSFDPSTWMGFSPHLPLPVSHQAAHMQVEPVPSYRGEGFTSRAGLIPPLRSHTAERPFSCSQCGKCFSRKFCLITHEKIHMGVKPFSCSQCGKCFSRKSSLITHDRVHTGERPFSCTQCGKRFSQRSHLIGHERTHTGVKPYVCPVCGKCYSRKADLDDHHRTHTGVKPYACSTCGKCFNNKSNFFTHQRTHNADGNGKDRRLQRWGKVIGLLK